MTIGNNVKQTLYNSNINESIAIYAVYLLYYNNIKCINVNMEFLYIEYSHNSQLRKCTYLELTSINRPKNYVSGTVISALLQAARPSFPATPTPISAYIIMPTSFCPSPSPIHVALGLNY